jgi:hypothetical protein
MFHLSVAFNAEMENTNNVIREICSVRCGEEGIVQFEERSFIYGLNRVLPQLKKYPINFMNCRDSLMFFPGILRGYPIIGNTSAILMELDMLLSSLSNTGLETGSFANKKNYWSLM